MRKARFGGLLASTALAGATILGGAGIASAQDTGSVDFNAVDGEDCTVEFTLKHPSTSTAYQIDYQINGEFDDAEGDTWADAKHKGLDQDTQTGPTRWVPTSEVSEDGDSHTTTETVDLANLSEDEKELPPANADGDYTIEYRLLFGPGTHTASAVKEVTVTGCVDENDNGEPVKDNPFDDIFGSVKGSTNLFDLDSLRANLSS